MENENGASANVTDNQTDVFPYIILPYKGRSGEKKLGKFKGFLRNLLPINVKPRFIYKGKKTGSFLGLKITLSCITSFTSITS